MVGLLPLCGCRHHYLMTLSNGGQTISSTKPKLQGTIYHFTGSDGAGCMIPQSRVVKIKTISSIGDEQKPVSPAKPKRPKHWYFLWVA